MVRKIYFNGIERLDVIKILGNGCSSFECENTKNRLELHHIIPVPKEYRGINSPYNDIDNLVILCQHYHLNFERYYRKELTKGFFEKKEYETVGEIIDEVHTIYEYLYNIKTLKVLDEQIIRTFARLHISKIVKIHEFSVAEIIIEEYLEEQVKKLTHKISNNTELPKSTINLLLQTFYSDRELFNKFNSTLFIGRLNRKILST